MFHLPIDIQKHIYSFDSTYHEKYQEVIENILPINEQVIRKFCKENNFQLLENEENYYKLSNGTSTIYREVITYDDLEKYTIELLWAFEYNFIRNHISNLTEKAYNNLQKLEYDANDIIYCLIKDFNYFMQDYIHCEVYIDNRMDIVTINNTDYYLKEY